MSDKAKEGRMSDPRDVAQRHNDAWNEKDVESRKECISPDIELQMPGGMRLQGLEHVLELESVFWEALPDAQIKPTDVFVAGNTVIAEGVMTGTHTGTFRMPQGEIPPSGNPINLRYASVKRIAEDKLVSEHLYFDQMEFMTQLGALPGPA
jgi:predicted ester cyclase